MAAEPHPASELDEERRATLDRAGQRWEYTTTAWNTFEAVVSVVAGLVAHSLALVAFGLDSTVEVFASLIESPWGTWRLLSPAETNEDGPNA